jgi:transglutaminase-like putative cysteine protease
LADEPRRVSALTIDYRDVDWANVTCATYALEQRFTYRYPGPIRELYQRLIVIPRAVHGDQRLRSYRLDVDRASARRVEQLDAFGNHVVSLYLPSVERRVGFGVSLGLERHAADPPPMEPAAAATVYLRPTRLTEPSPALVKAGAAIRLPDGGGAEAKAEAIAGWVHESMRYEKDVTSIDTTAAEAFALGAGVCQDFAHVMLVLCRLNGIPARYVSGHLLGEGGTHAWVEVLLPAADAPGMLVARAFDPTHGRAAGLSYLTVAVGRDYADVPPTSGTFQAPYGGVLRASKQATVTDVRYGGTDGQPTDERGAA